MGLRWSGYMDDVWLGLFHHLVHVVEEAFDIKPLAKLFRHEQFVVANANNVAPINASDRPGMGIGNFAASNYRNLKHDLHSRSSRKI